MGAPTKRARKIRNASEFDVAKFRAAIAVPKGSGVSLASWTLEEIYAARDAQLRGDFRLPARAAESMRTDDALMVAFENRCAPVGCVKVQMDPAKGARGGSIANEGDALFGQCGVAVTPDTVASIEACLVNHAIAFGVNTWTPREDGTRVDVEHHAWPIEHVKWDSHDRCYKTRVEPTAKTSPALLFGEEVITHGDGRWVIYQRHEVDPFKHGAILAALVVWARHAYAVRDWSKGSVAHGSAKVVGSLAEGVPLQVADDEGVSGVSDDAAAFIEFLRSLVVDDAPCGVLPFGAKIDFLTNNSTAWQVWSELVRKGEKAAARIYLGTDGILGTDGGAPGVDVASLFGVASTKVEGDLACIRRGIETGIIEPWCAVNFGDSSLSPGRKWLLPDADADAARASLKTRTDAFHAHIRDAKDLGFVIDQPYVDSVAALYDVAAPKLPEETDAKVPTVTLAPTDLARVVSVNEARASAGLGNLALRDGSEDPDGYLTVEQFALKKAATVAPSNTPAAPPAA